MTDLNGARFQASLSDRYVFDRVLGRGGMGTVYLAREVKHGRQVAIKALAPAIAQEVGARQFLREIRVTAQLQHPNVLSLIDSGEAADSPYYVMPYVKAGSLRELLERRKRLPVSQALAIVREVADALGYAHENGIVHCDIKPENILLSAGHAVLADFGIARVQRPDGPAWRAAVNSSAGTPAYMSPEQASGERDLDARSDLYSLACLLFEMIAGEPPFEGDSDQAVIASRFTQPVPRLSDRVPHVPLGLSMALQKAMALHPDDRYHSMRRFMRAVDSEAMPTASAVARPRRRWTEVWRIWSYRLASRMGRRVRSSVDQSRKTLDTAARVAHRLPLSHNTLG